MRKAFVEIISQKQERTIGTDFLQGREQQGKKRYFFVRKNIIIIGERKGWIQEFS